MGIQEENQHSLQRKQGAGVRRKEKWSEGKFGHNFYFLKIYTEVWLIFSVVSSAHNNVTQYTHKIYFFLNLFHVVYH